MFVVDDRVSGVPKAAINNQNYYALLFLLVPGRARHENLLVRQVKCTNGTSRAWQFHSPGTM